MSNYQCILAILNPVILVDDMLRLSIVVGSIPFERKMSWSSFKGTTPIKCKPFDSDLQNPEEPRVIAWYAIHTVWFSYGSVNPENFQLSGVWRCLRVSQEPFFLLVYLFFIFFILLCLNHQLNVVSHVRMRCPDKYLCSWAA